MKINAGINRILSILCLCLTLALSACAGNDTGMDDERKVSIYYVNLEETGITASDYILQSDLSDTEALIDELIGELSKTPNELAYEAPLTGRISLIGYKLEDGNLTLNFDKEYNNVAHVTEILDRAAMVRTLTQIAGVTTVIFQVDGEPLTAENGKPVGSMTEDTFIYNAGNEINTYEKVTLTLYFANEKGDKLVKVYRTVVYNSNISTERLALEQLIAGPNADEVYPTLNPASAINTVTVRDGICYVDFNKDFLTETYEVTANTAIYSIVNSLSEFTDVNKVQITVGGDKNVKFMDSVSLSAPFERNLEIIEE